MTELNPIKRHHVFYHPHDESSEFEEFPYDAFTNFDQLSLMKRNARLLWCSVMGTPAVEPKTLPFGRRISFRDDKSDLLIVKRETVSYYEVQGPCAIEQRTSIYSPFEALCVCFEPKGYGNFAVGTRKGLVFVQRTRISNQWDWRLLGSDKDIVDCLDFHPRGTFIAMSGPMVAGFRIYNRSTCTCRPIRQFTERVTDLKFSPCGNYVMTVCDFRWIMIWDVQQWRVVKVFGREADDFVRSVVWCSPTYEKICLLMSFSKSSYLLLSTINSVNNNILPLMVNATERYLNATFKGERHNCVKCMAWDVFGYRLAVLLDHPHDKVGSVAIFRTMGLEIQFMGYVDLDLKHRIRHSKFHASMTERVNRAEGAVEFSVYVNGEVVFFSSPLDGIEKVRLEQDLRV